MPTTIDSAGITFNDTSTITSANTFISKPASPSNGQVLSYNGSTWTGAALSASPSTAKAWVAFQGVGVNNSSITLKDSFNVTSVARTGLGLYTVNIANGLYSDVNKIKAIASTGEGDSGNAVSIDVLPLTSTSVGLVTWTSATLKADETYNCIVFF